MPLNATERAVLNCFIDTLLPPWDKEKIDEFLQDPDISKSDKEKKEKIRQVLGVGGSSLGITEAIEEKIRLGGITSAEASELRLLLSLLGSSLGSTLFCGTNPLKGPFCTRSLEERCEILLGLASSRFIHHRKAFTSVKKLVLALALSVVKPGETSNPIWDLIGYGPAHKLFPEERFWDEFDYRKETLLNITGDRELEFDVVVIGSGAGGGVSAANLSQAGYSVLVLEKAAFQNFGKMTGFEIDAFNDMYEKNGLLTTKDQSMTVLAGATVGGGTLVNWACCIQTPDPVREEWTQAPHKLSQFKPSETGQTEFDRSIESVLSRIGASDKQEIVHNGCNQNALRGCARLGLKVKETGQNLKDTSRSSAGWTSLGDRYGNKQSGVVTYLMDAAKAGCKIIDCCTAERVLFEEKTDGRHRACGVQAFISDAEGNRTANLKIRAKRCVVAACGAIHTPALFMRSKLTNPHIGKHLKLHPVTGALGDFRNEVNCFEGAPMTTVCGEFENGRAKDYHGPKLECPSTHPGLMAAALPWVNDVDAKYHVLRLRHLSLMIVLQRDRGEGSIHLDPYNPTGTPIIDYQICQEDKDNMIDGLNGCLEILVAAGAARVATTHNIPIDLRLSDCEDPITTHADEIQELKEKVKAKGLPQCGVALFSAHQMGTCRMGSDPSSSVVDEDGECWEVDDLYVMDGSNFPSASGANPMVTILSISDMISKRLAKRLRTEDGVEVDGDILTERRIQRRLRVANSPTSLGGGLILPLGVAAVSAVAYFLMKSYLSTGRLK